MPPVAGEEVDLQAELDSKVSPQCREMPGLHHQDPVPRGERIDECGLPGAGARRGVEDDRCGGLENALKTFEHFKSEAGEFGTAMVGRRPTHGAQDPVRNVRGPGNLKEMTSAGKIHAPPSLRKTDVRRISGRVVPGITRSCNTAVWISQYHCRHGSRSGLHGGGFFRFEKEIFSRGRETDMLLPGSKRKITISGKINKA